MPAFVGSDFLIPLELVSIIASAFFPLTHEFVLCLILNFLAQVIPLPFFLRRRAERERSEELSHGSRDCNYFGLSPEERREKQAIEESRSLYEIQQRDEQAFPALCNVCCIHCN